jgi:hypothetical protein
MVQVDVFWAYGLGGSLAAAAGVQLAEKEEPWVTPYFVKTLLFLALIWSPTGLLLLLRHPSWETMQAAERLTDLPPLLVLAFGITNVTQGILGFWVGHRLMRASRSYAATLSWMFGYFGMFFILLYGWDGRGWDRFLYDRDAFGGAAWTPGAGIQPGAGIGFLTSSVAETLYLDGLFLVPPLLYWFATWLREGAAARGERDLPSAGLLALRYLGAVFLLALPSAGVAALLVHGVKLLLARALSAESAHIASYFVGLPAALALLWLTLYRPGAPAHGFLTGLAAARTPSPTPATT